MISRYVLLIIICFSLISCYTDSEIDIQDYPEILTIQELAELYDITILKDENTESATLVKYFDGSTEINYEYDALETKLKDIDPFYLAVDLHRESSLSDAKQTFSLLKTTLRTADKFNDLKHALLKELNHTYDQLYFANREEDIQNNYGLVLIARKNKTVYVVLTSGIILDGKSFLKNAVIPKF